MSNHPHTTQERTLFGFWLYILSDCVLFAGLFATFAVLRGSTFGGPGVEDLLNIPFVLGETLLLLTSSFAMGIAIYAASKPETSSQKVVLVALFVALLLGLGF